MTHVSEMSPNLHSTSDAPPPYSDPILPVIPATPVITQTPRLRNLYGTERGWSESPAGRKAMSQLRRYLIEILAFTFEVDMTILNAALGQVENTKTMLSELEHSSLLALAHLIRNMCAKLEKPTWLTIPDSDFTMLIEAVVKPARILELKDRDVLKLLSSYADHHCDPSRRANTLVAQRIPWLMKYRSVWGDRLLALGATVRSHLDVAQLVAHNEGVRKLLGEAMIEWQERRGLEDLVMSRHDESMGEYFDLCEALRSQGGTFW